MFKATARLYDKARKVIAEAAAMEWSDETLAGFYLAMIAAPGAVVFWLLFF
jgi:hypothetical protein